MYNIIKTRSRTILKRQKEVQGSIQGSTLQVDKIPVFIRTQMAVEWILSTVHTFRRENFLLV